MRAAVRQQNNSYARKHLRRHGAQCLCARHLYNNDDDATTNSFDILYMLAYRHKYRALPMTQPLLRKQKLTAYYL